MNWRVGAGVTVRMIFREISKDLEAKWFHDNFHHKSEDSILKMVTKVHQIYTEGRKRQVEGRLNHKAYKAFVELYEKKKKLFDLP